MRKLQTWRRDRDRNSDPNSTHGLLSGTGQVTAYCKPKFTYGYSESLDSARPCVTRLLKPSSILSSAFPISNTSIFPSPLSYHL